MDSFKDYLKVDVNQMNQDENNYMNNFDDNKKYNKEKELNDFKQKILIVYVGTLSGDLFVSRMDFTEYFEREIKESESNAKLIRVTQKEINNACKKHNLVAEKMFLKERDIEKVEEFADPSNPSNSPDSSNTNKNTIEYEQER